MKIEINKELPLPVYKQIYSQIVTLIENETIENKFKLPPERILSDQLNVSRGTIKKAYEKLIEDGFAIAERGSGTFIIKKDFSNLDLIENAIDKLIGDGFNFNDIEYMFNLKLLSKKNNLENLNVAIIDCNPEALDIIRNQVSLIKNMNCIFFLLKDVFESKNPNQLFKDFDFLITTSTHFKDIFDLIKNRQDKIIKVVMNVQTEIILKLASIKNINEVSVITKSSRFSQIIKQKLSQLNIEVAKDNYKLIKDINSENFDDYFKDKKYIIMPPLYTMNIDEKLGEKFFEFSHNGGEIIIFNYSIERGSIFYIRHLSEQPKNKF